MSLVPAPFLFRFSMPIVQVKNLPRAKSPLIQLPAKALVPFPSSMESATAFASCSLGWNQHGLAILVSVEGKSTWPRCSPNAAYSSDCVRLWLDTRDTQTIHRASRYCHHFCLLPIGDGADGMDPVIKQFPISRASEDAPQIDEDTVLLESQVTKSGYTVAAWFPQETLHGFDPDSYARLGFYICINDHELGRQFFTVGDEFPYQNDPSLWVSLELKSD